MSEDGGDRPVELCESAFLIMNIKLKKELRAELIGSIQRYFDGELEQEICDLRAGLLLDFFFKEAGPLAYNKGVEDAERFFRERLEDLSATCYEPPLAYSKG